MLPQNYPKTHRQPFASDPYLQKARTGLASKDPASFYYLTIKPFWLSPINLLPHNMYAASQLPLADAHTLTINFVGFLGVLIASYYVENGPQYLLMASAAAWLLWIMNIGGSREMLSSKELWLYIIH